MNCSIPQCFFFFFRLSSKKLISIYWFPLDVVLNGSCITCSYELLCGAWETETCFTKLMCKMITIVLSGKKKERRRSEGVWVERKRKREKWGFALVLLSRLIPVHCEIVFEREKVTKTWIFTCNLHPKNDEDDEGEGKRGRFDTKSAGGFSSRLYEFWSWILK